MTPPRSFVHYVGRRVTTAGRPSRRSPWFSEAQGKEEGFVQPKYHVTRARHGPASRVEAGDLIWLFAQLQSRWAVFPPSLDARIVVSDVRALGGAGGNRGGFRYEAGPDSKWFPLYDATETLRTLSTIDSHGSTRPLLDSPDRSVGAALRAMRQLVDAAPLFALEEHLETIGFDFVSYRLADGTPKAAKKASELVLGGAAVFWDRWSLPRRLVERREVLDDSALTDHIREQMRGSTTVWGIVTDSYAEAGSYSRAEMDLARSLGKFREV